MRRGFLLTAFLAIIVMEPSCSAAKLNSEQSFFRFDELSTASSTEWPTYGHDYGNQRFSLLAEINTANVRRLVPAFVFQTGVLGPFESSPIVYDGVLYLTSAYDGVFALDAESGHLLWKLSPLVGRFRQCCGPVNRGVAVSQDLVVVGRLDCSLLALDRKTGAIRWRVRMADNSAGYSITMAPLVYKSSVLVGLGGSDLGIRGSLSSYSLRDGKLQWRWFATDPQHWFGAHPRLRSDTGEYSRALSSVLRREFAGSWKRGGGGIWTTPAIDQRTDTVYFTTGNPWPDLDGTVRPGDNLFTDCIVALNASTGRLKWYFQQTPHDLKDLDVASPPVLFETNDALGNPTRAVGEAGKTGFFYILNRDTGELLRRSVSLSSLDSTAGKGAWAGGATWSALSFDPRLGYVVILSEQHLIPASKKTATTPLEAMEREWQRVYGAVTAVNVSTGTIVWQDDFDSGIVGGSVSTAGGLTLLGEGDGHFDAFDTKTGARLWQFQTGAGVNAPPVVYMAHGREYIAVAAGGNQQLGTPVGDSLFVFRLN